MSVPTYIHTHTHTHTHTRPYAYIHTYIHTGRKVYVDTWYTDAHIYLGAYTHGHTHTYMVHIRRQIDDGVHGPSIANRRVGCPPGARSLAAAGSRVERRIDSIPSDVRSSASEQASKQGRKQALLCGSRQQTAERPETRNGLGLWGWGGRGGRVLAASNRGLPSVVYTQEIIVEEGWIKKPLRTHYMCSATRPIARGNYYLVQYDGYGARNRTERGTG